MKGSIKCYAACAARRCRQLGGAGRSQLRRPQSQYYTSTLQASGPTDLTVQQILCLHRRRMGIVSEEPSGERRRLTTSYWKVGHRNTQKKKENKRKPRTLQFSPSNASWLGKRLRSQGTPVPANNTTAVSRILDNTGTWCPNYERHTIHRRRGYAPVLPVCNECISGSRLRRVRAKKPHAI